ASSGFTPDGKALVLGGVAGETRVWRFDEGRDAWRLPAPPEGRPAIDLSPDGKWLVLVRPEVTEVHDAATGAKVAELPAGGGWAAFAAGGRRLAVAGNDGKAAVFDVAERRLVLAVSVAAGKDTEATLSPDGTRLMVVNERGAW